MMKRTEQVENQAGFEFSRKQQCQELNVRNLAEGQLGHRNVQDCRSSRSLTSRRDSLAGMNRLEKPSVNAGRCLRHPTGMAEYTEVITLTEMVHKRFNHSFRHSRGVKTPDSFNTAFIASRDPPGSEPTSPISRCTTPQAWLYSKHSRFHLKGAPSRRCKPACMAIHDFEGVPRGARRQDWRGGI